MKNLCFLVLLMIVFCCNIALAQTEDRCIHKDTLRKNDEAGFVKDTAYCKSVVCSDTIKSKMQYQYKNEQKYDAFMKKIKELWLGDILKNIFFK